MSRRPIRLLPILLLALSICCFASSASAEKKRLDLSRIARVTVRGKNLICASFNGRTYKPAKRVKGRGSVYKSFRGNSAQRAACSSLTALGTVTLSSLPSPSGMLRANNTSSGISVRSASGAPPALPEIPELPAEDLFWRAGVVNAVAGGSPTQDECDEFLHPTVDGDSSGYTACYMVQNVGFAFQNILRSGTNLCYMKGLPTQANVDAGILAVVQGSFPGGDPSLLFSTPTGSTPRVVKIRAAGGGDDSNIFIRVYDSASNAALGDTYRYDFWACEGSNPQPQEYESGRIQSSGLYLITGAGASDDGNFLTSVTAYLRREAGSLVFDTTRSRTAENYFQSSSFNSKSVTELSASNIVTTKSYDVAATDPRKSYSIARISGSSLSDLRFLEGAYKEIFVPSGFSPESREGGIEFRTSYYANAPAGAYVSSLASVSLESDPFYASIGSVTYDPSAFSCSQVPDVELAADLTNPAFGPVQASCEGQRLDGMDFCSSSALQNAYAAYNSVCAP